jgi:DNA-binding response OmpR family regulator
MLADDGALRRKLGDRAGCLQTVRGAGCRFTAAP